MPLEGKIHETHPNERSYSTAKCYQRGYHLGATNGIGGFTACVDCGISAAPGGLTFKDVALEPDRRKIYTDTLETLTHNPNASFAELMAARAETKEERKARLASTGVVADSLIDKLTPAERTKVGEAYLVVVKTRDNIIKWAIEFGIALVDPEGRAGTHLAMASKLEAAEKRAAQAEAMLADKDQELKAVQAELKAAQAEVASAQAAPAADPVAVPAPQEAA